MIVDNIQNIKKFVIKKSIVYPFYII